MEITKETIDFYNDKVRNLLQCLLFSQLFSENPTFDNLTKEYSELAEILGNKQITNFENQNKEGFLKNIELGYLKLENIQKKYPFLSNELKPEELAKFNFNQEINKFLPSIRASHLELMKYTNKVKQTKKIM